MYSFSHLDNHNIILLSILKLLIYFYYYIPRTILWKHKFNSITN